MPICGLNHLLEESQSDRLCRNLASGTWEAGRPPVPVLRGCPVTAGLGSVTGTCSGYVVCETAWVRVDEDQCVLNKVNQAEVEQT